MPLGGPKRHSEAFIWAEAVADTVPRPCLPGLWRDEVGDIERGDGLGWWLAKARRRIAKASRLLGFPCSAISSAGRRAASSFPVASATTVWVKVPVMPWAAFGAEARMRASRCRNGDRGRIGGNQAA